ncbi:MAG: hypothetical protein AAB345_01000 [Patescibacteria group bacterium]
MKLTIATKVLREKLMEIEKHLRDCSEDIIVFSKFLASRLDPEKRPETMPEDFVLDWYSSIDAINREVAIYEIYLEHDRPSAQRLIASCIRVQETADRLMPMFAEDLCGKEFSKVAVLRNKGTDQSRRLELLAFQKMVVAASNYPDLSIFPSASSKGVALELAHLRELREETGMVLPTPFTPDKPFSSAPSIGNPIEEGKPADWAGFTKEGVRQPELEDCAGCHEYDMSLAEQISIFESHCPPFPPEPPLMEQEANRLGDVERISPPPIPESGSDAPWDDY